MPRTTPTDAPLSDLEPEESPDLAPRDRRRWNPSIVLLCLATAAATAAVVAFAMYHPVPPSLAVAAEPKEAALVAEDMTDARTVELKVEVGEESSLTSPASGTITRTSCSPGATLTSATTSFTIDSDPLVNLHTGTPLWRSLKFGDRGEDVVALQHEFARLGYAVTETARFDWQTWIAWDTIVESLGGDTTYGELDLSRIVWLPTAQVTASACPLRLGEKASSGGALVSLPSTLLSASVKTMPSDLLPGTRTLTVNDIGIAISEEGAVTAEGLGTLAGTDAYRNHAKDAENTPLEGTLTLAEPLTAYPVPPAAVAMTEDTSGCVASMDGDALPVTVVSSKLGRSYITFADAPTVDAVQARAPKDLSCS